MSKAGAAIVRRNGGTAAAAGPMDDAGSDTPVGPFSAAPLPEPRTMEQQLSLRDPAISDAEHLLFGWKQAADAATSQQQTDCTTAPVMLHA